MHLFQPSGCRAYINKDKETRRNNHKSRANLAIFVGFQENTVPGYKFCRPLIRDFVTTAHARFMKFTTRSVINLNPQSDIDEVKEGAKVDFGDLVCKIERVVEENNLRRGSFVVTYRRLVYANGTRGP